jgi:hypothetical protein
MRAVLHDEVDRDAIDDAAHRLEWQLVNVIAAAHGRPEQLIFATRSGHVFLVNDERLGVSYLQGESLQGALPCYGAEDHHALCASDDLETIRRGLALTVLCASGPDEARVALLGRALASSDENVRKAAFVAITYAPWPELVPHVEAMRDGDPQSELREGAARWLATVCPTVCP